MSTQSQYATLTDKEKLEILRGIPIEEYKALPYIDKKALGFDLGAK